MPLTGPEPLTCYVCTGGQGWLWHAGKVSCSRGEGAGGARPVWGLWEAGDSWAAGRGCLGHLAYIRWEGNIRTTGCPSRNPTESPHSDQPVGLGSLGRGKENFQRTTFQDGVEEKALELHLAPEILVSPSVKWTQLAQTELRSAFIFLDAPNVPLLLGHLCLTHKLAMRPSKDALQLSGSVPLVSFSLPPLRAKHAFSWAIHGPSLWPTEWIILLITKQGNSEKAVQGCTPNCSQGFTKRVKKRLSDPYKHLLLFDFLMHMY